MALHFIYTFYSAGLVNFFIPSGGGQWGRTGTNYVRCCYVMGADYAKTAITIALVDTWTNTNMIQPFWALPALAIAGLKAKEIMGFCLLNL